MTSFRLLGTIGLRMLDINIAFRAWDHMLMLMLLLLLLLLCLLWGLKQEPQAS